jgi:putative ATP-binding cassette transporter
MSNVVRDFLQVAIPFFRSEDRWRAQGLLAGIVAVEVALVYLFVLTNEWNVLFYNSLQDRNWDAFVWSLIVFLGLAASMVVLVVAQYFLGQSLIIRWREWMVRRYLENWLSESRLYRVQFVENPVDNIHLRIASDVHLFIQYTLELGTGLLSSIMTLASFVVILWSLSSLTPLSAFGLTFTIPGYLVWVALLYAATGTMVAHFIGRPLIAIDFNQQRREADFRFAIARVADHAEPIAMMGGEAVERATLISRFCALVHNWRNLVRRQSALTTFATGYGQASTVFPVLVASPAYFFGALSLGVLMQTVSAFQRVEGAFAFFIGVYGKVAEWKALIDRLTQFEAALESLAAASDGIAMAHGDKGQLQTSDLDLNYPTGVPLTKIPALSLSPGQRLLVTGTSGSGKSSLLRALRGLWRFGRGSIALPESVIAIPQRPYFPLGSLKAAITYPIPADEFDDQAVRSVMGVVGIEHLIERLHEEGDWRVELSGGEQQRAALAGVLLRPPRVLLLDDPTAAMEEANGRELFARLSERLPQTAIVTVGRRSVLGTLHEQIIELKRITHARPLTRPLPAAGL